MRPRRAASVLRWATRLFGRDAAARVFEPLISDWQHEQRYAATWWRRGLTAARWTLALVATTACVSWRHASPGWQATRAMGLFSAIGTIVLIAPFFQHLPSAPRHAVRLVGYLMPQAVALAVPFAVLPAAMALGAVATAASAGHLRRRLCSAVAGIVLLTAVGLAWVVPEANQAFRETTRSAMGITPGALPRGVRELGIVDLWFARGVAPDAARRELHAKAAIALAWPLALAFLGWRLGRHRQSAPAGALLFWWIAAAALTAVGEPARQTPYLRESPYLMVGVAWWVAALPLRPGGGASWRPDAPFVRRR